MKIKKIKSSSLQNGQEAIMTNACGRFHKGETVIVVDNEKKRSRYEIKVKNDYGTTGFVPNDYLKARKKWSLEESVFIYIMP